MVAKDAIAVAHAAGIRLEAANVDDAHEAGFPLCLPCDTVVSRVISPTVRTWVRDENEIESVPPFLFHR
jgi:hypothetical protein